MYDAIVVGAGHNGLVSAWYLANAGLRVLALERREFVGGAAITEELWPGYSVSTCSYISYILQPRIIDDLDLREHGYEVYPLSKGMFMPFPDGRSLVGGQRGATIGQQVVALPGNTLAAGGDHPPQLLHEGADADRTGRQRAWHRR